MKILHLTKKYPPETGGDSVAVYNLKKQQVKAGHEVYVAVSNCKDVDNNEVLKLGLKESLFNLDRITPRRILSLVLVIFWGFKNLRKLKINIIHSHSADLGFFISIAAGLYGVPVVNTCHGISFNDKQYSFLKRFAEKFFLKYAGFRKIIAIDTRSLDALEKARIGDIAYIPNGIDLQRFQNGGGKNNFKTRFLFVGRLEKQKGIIYLIKAAAILKGKKDFEIIIVGEGSESRYLVREMHNLGLEGLVNFTGKIDEKTLNDYYTGCDIFVLPSLWEGMPLTLLEAAAAGMPAIASDVGGISSLFINEENALIIEPKNTEALASAMLKLINDKKCREMLAKNARKLVEKYSWENTAKMLDKIYSMGRRGRENSDALAQG